MNRIKRRQFNDTFHGDYQDKKRKLKDENNNINKTILENLPNEIIYEIFKYLDTFNIYEGFFELNKRFKYLLTDRNLRIRINISNQTKLHFERFYIKIILPHRHRISNLCLSNPFTTDIVFSPPRFIMEFSELKSLTLGNINKKSFDNISTYLMFLPKLHSLVINFVEYIQYPSIVFSQIFRLSKLKSCKITYQEKDQYRSQPIHLTKYDSSPIEYLVINTRFPFQSFEKLLSCLPKLRHLSIDCLVYSSFIEIEMEDEKRPIISKRLKSVSLKLDSINFNRLENFIKNYFRHVEVLRLTAEYNPEYLNAQRWERLIPVSMPTLRIFDLNIHGYDSENQLTFHDLINQFNSSFWIEKQWFFTHQHHWLNDIIPGIFYSTNPYRRKDYTFYWDLDQNICSDIIQENLHSLKHVLIDSKQATNRSMKYFPNATELTIKQYFQTVNASIPKTLNRIMPLQKLTKLVIECYNFPFEQIIKLIRFTPNLHTLKFSSITLHEVNTKLIEQGQIFQYVSNTNRIKSLDLHSDCSLEKVQLIINLFPNLEYLKTGMKREEVHQTVQFLLSKNNLKTRHLFYLCISEIAKRFLKELNVLIKSKNLLEDYYIKFVNRDFHLWW